MLYFYPSTCYRAVMAAAFIQTTLNLRCPIISPVFHSEPLLFLLDEFNRVIIPVKRGEENTDYINASFIDVSKTRLTSASTTALTEIPLSEP